MTEEDLAVNAGPELPDVWTSYTVNNDTRHAYYRSGYDCNLSISQSVTHDDRFIYQTTIDCDTTVSRPQSNYMLQDSRNPVMSVFGEYHVVIEDLPSYSWDVLHLLQNDTDSYTGQSGLAMLESVCWIYDRNLIGLLD